MNITRRSFFGCAALPLLPSWLGGIPGARRTNRRLILVWLDGGLSHLDSFDGKPEAPVDVRGDMELVRADVDGVFIAAPLQKLRSRFRHMGLIRSLTHGEGNHDRGTHLLLTGYRPSPVLQYPSLFSARASASDAADPKPAYVTIPNVPDHGGAGFLPAAYAPFSTGGDPSKPDFAVANLGAAKEADRLDRLVAALDELDGGPRSAAERDRDTLRAKVLAMRVDPALRELFDLRREKPALRARFGHHRLGQSALLALRLARAGVKTVLVRDVGYDHHVGILRALTYGFPPKLTQIDDAVSALLDTLREEGLDDDVTVCVASEFGRTPRLNPAGGRDHWPRAQSVLLFGGGVRPGVIGRTDSRGEEPAEDPVTPQDLCATLLHVLGDDASQTLHTSDGRPVRLLPEGSEPIEALIRR